jgi:hypothetical protein
MRVQVSAVFDGAVVEVRLVDDTFVVGKDFPLDGQLVTLVARTPAGFVVRPPGGVEIVLELGAPVRVEIAGVSFFVELVEEGPRVPRPLPIDWRAQAHSAGIALVAALFMAMANAIPPEPASLSIDDFLNSRRFATVLFKPPLDEHPPEIAMAGGPGNPGGAAKGLEGKHGKENIPPKKGRMQVAGKTDLRVAKLMAADAVQKAGVIGILRATQTSSIAAIWGRADSALGPDADNVMGNLIGLEPGEGDGLRDALGTSGRGPGGGGQAESIGFGKLPTIGGGGGGKPGYGGGPVGALPKDKKKDAKIEAWTPGPTKLIGGLDKELVRRTVRSHLNEIRYCYDHELQSKPGLEGRVVTGFTISGNGAVLASVIESTSLHDPIVEQCIASAVRRWAFPKPASPGMTVVSYPFVLRQAGSN